MKYKTRLNICSLLVCLTALINSCSEKKPSIEFIHSIELNFPSASAIEYHQNKLYVLGDDAPSLLILSTDYKMIDTIPFWARHNGRISKEKKHDIESAMIKDENGELVLFGIGSMSAATRWTVLKYNLTTKVISQTSFFDTGKTFPGINAINIEGSCAVGDTFILINRANLSNPVNQLLFWKHRDSITTKKIIVPPNKMVAGISGLYYVKEKDILLFTASEEETASTIADGAIGNSYLGWIENFSKKLNAPEFRPDKFLKLSEVDKVFTKQKIESVCVGKIDSNAMVIHLVADNDNGKSRFFKMKLFL